MGRMTDEELDEMGLTEEEREALLEDDGGEEVDDIEDDEDDEGDSDDGQEGGDAGADGGDGEADADADAEEVDEPEESQKPRPAPILTAEDAEDADERLTEIAEQKERLIEQFDDGDLTAKEYQLELDKLAKQEREIEQTVFKANIAREMAEQQQHNEWMAQVDAFLTENPHYRQSKLMYQTLDIAVRQVASDEANRNLSGRQILEKAHSQIVEQFGLEGEKEAGADKAARKPGRKPISAPPTLARVPAADMTETENTRWSKLDRLMETDPERYEREVAKLSEADHEAYLASH